jgi:hypothetical protein
MAKSGSIFRTGVTFARVEWRAAARGLRRTPSNENYSALTDLARNKDRDVANGDARPGGDAFPRRQLDRSPLASAGDPADLGDPDQPSVGLACDFDVEALADRGETAVSGMSGTTAPQRLRSPQSGLNRHKDYS